VLAGGALSGSIERHPIASPPPEPIGSAMRYDADLARAQRLLPLVKEGFAASLTEAATRFAISNSAVGTILVGMATPQRGGVSVDSTGRSFLSHCAEQYIANYGSGNY
jgi:aryl-alcohol dehydrogenase-like predicted oxidoreductase